MSRLIKALAITLGVLVALVVLAVVFITQWVDPNDHKPELQRLAAEQGIDLQINGELGWQFFPALGVTVEGTRLASRLSPDKPIATLQHMSVAVEVMPLLERQLKVAAVEVEGVVIDLQTDLQGRNNWDLPQPTETSQAAGTQTAVTGSVQPETTEAPEATGSGLDLAADQISLRNVSVAYQNYRTAEQAAVKNLSVNLASVNLQGTPFPVHIAGELHQLQDLPALGISLDGALGFDGKQLSLQPLHIEVAALDQADLAPVAQSVEGNISLGEAPAFDLTVAVQPLNARAWLALLGQPQDMADGQALTSVAAKLRVQGQGESLLLKPLQLTVDDSVIEGQIGLNQPEQLPLEVVLGVDQLNLDRYLPASAESAETGGAKAAASSSSVSSSYGKPKEQKLPLETLRELKLKLTFTAGQLQAANAKLSNLNAQLRSNLGVAYLDELSFDTYDGRVEANGHLDGRRSEARTELMATINGVELLGLLQDTMQEQRLQGAVSSTLKASSRGSTIEQLQRQLAADINLQAQALQVNELDIEKDVCTLAALFKGEAIEGRVWKGYTHLQDVDGQFTLSNQEVTIDQLTAGAEDIQVSARGELSLQKQRYEIPLDVMIIGQRDESLSCQIRDNLRNRTLPFVLCKGSLESIGANDCRIDKNGVAKLVEAETKKKLQDKFEKKVREKLGDENTKAVERLLPGIFGR